VDGLNAGETINGGTLPVAVYQDASDNEFYACDADDTDKLDFVGFAISNGTDGNSIDIQFEGIVDGFTGLVEGSRYYVQDDKTIGTTPGTYMVLVGIAISETELMLIGDEMVPGFYGSAQTDTSGASTAKDGSKVVYTPRRARIIEFCVCFMSVMQSGSNSTRIRTYKVQFDLIRQKYQAYTLESIDAGNETSISLYTAGANWTDTLNKWASFSSASATMFSTGGSSYSCMTSIVSTENAITFSYRLNDDANSNQGGVYISAVKVLA